MTIMTKIITVNGNIMVFMKYADDIQKLLYNVQEMCFLVQRKVLHDSKRFVGQKIIFSRLKIQGEIQYLRIISSGA